MGDKVKEVRLYKNGLQANHRIKMVFPMKRYIEIEFMDGKTIKLNCDNNIDLMGIDYMEVADKGKFIKYLFKYEI